MAWAVRIYKTYGGDAVRVMSQNPYRLARDIRGIGFKTADAIAMKLGVDKAAMVRVRAGISYALTEAMDEGHCGLPTDDLVPLAEKLLEVPQELIRTALGYTLTLPLGLPLYSEPDYLARAIECMLHCLLKTDV